MATDPPDLATRLANAINELVQPRWCAVVGPGYSVRLGASEEPAELDGSDDDLAAAATATVAVTDGIVLHLSHERTLTAGDHRVIDAYCVLAASLWTRVPELR